MQKHVSTAMFVCSIRRVLTRKTDIFNRISSLIKNWIGFVLGYRIRIYFFKYALSSAKSSCIEWTIFILYDLQFYMLKWQNNNLQHLLEYRNCKQYFNPSNQFHHLSSKKLALFCKACIEALGGMKNVLWKYGAYTFSRALHVITFIKQRTRTGTRTSKP